MVDDQHIDIVELEALLNPNLFEMSIRVLVRNCNRIDFNFFSLSFFLSVSFFPLVLFRRMKKKEKSRQ